MTQPDQSDRDHTGHGLILSSRVEGTTVLNTSGKSIGHIEDLSIDRIDGTVRYAILSFGGFLGIGKRFHPVPWSMLTFDPNQFGYVVDIDETVLSDAPHYDAEQLREFGGPSFDQQRVFIADYYGRGVPYI